MIEELLTEKYGDFKLVRLTGGYTNETFLLTGSHIPLVIKVAKTINEDIDNELNCLKITHKTGITLKAYCVYKVWKVLHKVQKSPKEVQEEWIRRLEWTIDTDIITFPINS